MPRKESRRVVPFRCHLFGHEDIPEELVEIAARAVRLPYFVGYAVEESDRRRARAVLSAVSEAGWVPAGEHNMLRAFVDRGEYADDVRAAAIAERDEARAQSEALAEALERIASFDPRPGYVEHAFVDVQAVAMDALALRSSQESSDAT